MNKIILLICLILVSSASFAQSRQHLRADSVYIQRDGGNGELILLNSTRDSTGGLLVNTGKGRTQFLKPRLVNDSILIIGRDSFLIPYRLPNDVAMLGSTENGVISVDTSYTSPCNTMPYESYDKIVLPQFKGKRVRVTTGGCAIPEGPCPNIANWFFLFDKASGTLKIFPGGGGEYENGYHISSY